LAANVMNVVKKSTSIKGGYSTSLTLLIDSGFFTRFCQTSGLKK
jgi:hypothetical protein